MRIVVCGIGSRDRGDDGFGPYIIDHLKDSGVVEKMDCELYPENYLNIIRSMSPDLVIFLDAMSGGEGEAVLLRNEEIIEKSPLSVTTHNLPFSAVVQFLRENGVPDIFFLGVQAASYERLSGRVKDIADRIIVVLNTIDKEQGFDIIRLYEALSEQLR
jgi:hydrogenase maturation protease